MALRTAAVVAVGSEMLGPSRVDTNSLYLSEKLASLGIELRVKSVVGDDRNDLATLFRQSLDRADLVILTGGLGPTDDDLTRDVVSEVLGRPMTIDERIVEQIRARFGRRGLKMPEVNRRQAQVPEGAVVLDNPNGTAPGLFLDHGGKVVVLLPGPPREMQPMFDRVCAGPLRDRAGTERVYRTSIFITGLGESHVEQRAQPIYARWRDAPPFVSTTILAAMGQVELHLSVREIDETRAMDVLDRVRAELLEGLGDHVYSTDGRVMEEVVGDLLKERGWTIAAAESCTGGLLMSRLTDVPGSSAYVRAGVVAYDNADKTALLGVPAELLARHGAVSEPVAVAMAEGIRMCTDADVAVGITGIAGPGGGTPEKPVGMVVIAVLAPGRDAYVRTFNFLGARTQVKYQATQAALDRVRRSFAAMTDDR
jgi:competence/damage-inducible protein CinA-like protein